VTRMLDALVNGSILGALVTGAVWLALRLTPRRVLNAATRYALWWATLAVVVALPTLYLPGPVRQTVSNRSLTAAAPATVATAVLQPLARTTLVHRSQLKTEPPLLHFPIQIAASGWPRWVMLTWAAAGLILLFRLLASFVLLGLTSARAQDAPLAVREVARPWLARGTNRRGVRLAGSPEIAIPVAVGPWRPAILIPCGLLEELGHEELEQIVLHEASHLARRDDYALLLQRLVEAVFAPHPVVRWIARRIDLEREIACDDRVIAVTGRPRSYATCLTRVVEWSGGVRSSLAAATAADGSSHLARRIDMLLDKTRHTGTQLLKARLTAMLAAVVLLAWIAGRSPGFVAFAAPLVRTLRQVPERILPRATLLPRVVDEPQAAAPEFEGRVVEDSSGNPVASAEVRFHKAGMRELAADLDTDRNGRALAPGLRAGEYAMEVVKPNFVTASLKVHVPVAGLVVRLVRYGVIGGQVTDQHGQPVPSFLRAPNGRTTGGTRVAVLVKEPSSGQLQLLREYPLEEGGRYRIFDLTPGQYAIGIWYDGLNDGSGVQLYPENEHPRFFTISGGEEYDHIDFLIAPQPTFHVSGSVEGATKGAQYGLALAQPDQPALPIAQTLSEDDGHFRFGKIPAGSYDLLVGGPSRGHAAHDTVLGPNALFGRIRVQVGGNVDGLSVPVSGGRSVTVTLHGCPGSAIVSAEPLDPWGLVFNHRAPVATGKEAEIGNLPPGRFGLIAADLPAGCFQVNQPVVDLAGAPGPVTIELAPAGSIHGTLRGAARPAEFSIVLLDAGGSPDAAAQLAQPDAQGRFTFDSLHPGRYRIAAKSRAALDVSQMVEIEVPAGIPAEVDLPAPVKGGGQ